MTKISFTWVGFFLTFTLVLQDKVLITLSSLLHESEFFTSLLHGLVFSSGNKFISFLSQIIGSLGGRSDVTTKCADAAIFEYIGRIKEDRTAVEDLVSCVSQYLSDNIQIIRVRDSILRFLPRASCFGSLYRMLHAFSCCLWYQQTRSTSLVLKLFRVLFNA